MKTLKLTALALSAGALFVSAGTALAGPVPAPTRAPSTAMAPAASSTTSTAPRAARHTRHNRHNAVSRPSTAPRTPALN